MADSVAPQPGRLFIPATPTPEEGDRIIEHRQARERDRSYDHLFAQVQRADLARLGALGASHATRSVFVAHLALMAMDDWHRRSGWVVAELADVSRQNLAAHNQWLEDHEFLVFVRVPGQRLRVSLWTERDGVTRDASPLTRDASPLTRDASPREKHRETSLVFQDQTTEPAVDYRLGAARLAAIRQQLRA